MKMYEEITTQDGKVLPVYVKEPDYLPKTIKQNSRQRKKNHDLEWGNASIVFQFDLDDDFLFGLEQWWFKEYEEKGNKFNVELYIDRENDIIELRFMDEKCFYRSSKTNADSVLKSVMDSYEILDKWITDNLELVYIGDFDYLEPADTDI